MNAVPVRVGKVGVAISTTGDEHRLNMLSKAVEMWASARPLKSPIVVTVDGDDAAAHRAFAAVAGYATVYRVGHRQDEAGYQMIDGRLGVAANKNTGLELLAAEGVNHMFLSDDDLWPLRPQALDLHCGLGRRGHSMVNWGAWYLRDRHWVRPRGSMLYVSEAILRSVGGMVEEFGTGGHEHVEWSTRIHRAKFTDVVYPAPREYLESNGMGAAAFWHGEDMPLPGEDLRVLRSRRDRISSMRRAPGAERKSDQIMKALDGHTGFVPYTAAENGRSSATLYHN